MTANKRMWLIHNDASGSNDRDAHASLDRCCRENGLEIVHRTSFPREELPTPQMLDAADIEIAAVFAGDGTINAAIDALAGWGGKVLVLPGGTMNLLYHRLFGDLETAAALQLVASDRATVRRPGIIATGMGNAYAGLLAGPGTAWNEVREAMRAFDVIGLAGEATEAAAHTLGDAPIRCADPELGRREGYPLLLLEPQDDGFAVRAYHAEGAGEFLAQFAALVRRNFREGPHDELGKVERLVLETVGADRVQVLLDGEPAIAGRRAELVLASCKVDLLAMPVDDQ